MPKPRMHPDFYYTIRDAVVAKMGPVFDEKEFGRHFIPAARPYRVAPFTPGYPAIRSIIMGLVKNKMRGRNAKVPKYQPVLV